MYNAGNFLVGYFSLARILITSEIVLYLFFFSVVVIMIVLKETNSFFSVLMQ